MLKQKLFEWIFKKEIKTLLARINERERAVHARELAQMAAIDQLENEKTKLQDMKRQYAMVDRVFRVFGNPKIIAKEKNKHGEELLVVEVRRGSSLDVYLVDGHTTESVLCQE